ncbi:glutamyl-tRNA(Gln) amidotransferase subunit [Saccharomycopsis crataegensis]|uniref:Glutamyl-tRNA(Gln) amidotransferase subunit B, mitochondrial n=1 Tax=Saccharomycopsis crataegensis TaxID=43959 RepID=A0AAV5QMU2_9ASCO|nr:glutamyl-tRNA(Gln) amidotransferase subunit [Saccharomycopsis crataegensis]
MQTMFARSKMWQSRTLVRSISTSRILLKAKSDNSVLLPQYKFKCGLEIHCQLKTDKKLFSNSGHTFNELPNSRVSFFDAGLPGTQPLVNPEAVLLALVAGVSLNSKINLQSTFDRKHYFYGDQPLGYQITQHYNPIGKGGSLKLLKKFDEIDEQEKTITLDQIQIEQDTGKCIHVEAGVSTNEYLNGILYSKIDLNRANTPLIEVVTNPDFDDLKQVKAFIKKFQSLVKFLNISTGELETGAMRIDVNISINGGNRVEIKNLSSSTAIIEALKYEYKRQIKEVESGNHISQETRGWNGSKTVTLRKKESKVDYRYMPDPELSSISLDKTIVEDIRTNFVSTLPDDMIEMLTSKPYGLRIKDAKLLINNTYDGLLDYYMDAFSKTVGMNDKVPSKIPGNFILHELIGQLGKFNLKFSPQILPVSKLSELINVIYIDGKLTNSSGKLLLKYIVENHDDTAVQSMTIDDLIAEFELEVPEQNDADLNLELGELCDEILSNHAEIVENLKNGKKLGSLQYLVGQGMRATQGKIQAKVFEEHFKKSLGLK